METIQSQTKDAEQAPATELPAENSADTSPMYWPVGAVEEGKDSDGGEPYDSLFEITSVWD